MATFYSAQPEPAAIQLVKLLCNAWATSRRMDKLPRSCVLGCLARDCLRHYMSCPVLSIALAQTLASQD